MPSSQSVAKSLAFTYWPEHMASVAQARVADSWLTTKQDSSIYSPRNSGEEFGDIKSKSLGGWANLVVSSLSQMIHMTGIVSPSKAVTASKGPGSMNSGNMKVWDIFERNGWRRRQIGLYRASIGHGASYTYCRQTPGSEMPMVRCFPATRMTAFYGDDFDDEFPLFAILADETLNDKGLDAWMVTLIEDDAAHRFIVDADGLDIKMWTYIDSYDHGSTTCPIVRYAGMLDLEGRAQSVIEPLFPLLRRIDQDTFDRLIVQRFGAWKVRWATGLAMPENSTPDQQNRIKQRLYASDMMVSDNSDVKFGTMSETALTGFIESRDADLRDLSAVSQVPPHHLLGVSANLGAESIQAVNEGANRKAGEWRESFSESDAKTGRLLASLHGITDEANAYDMTPTYQDFDSRSLSQSADAAGKMADQLDIPVQMLWRKYLPNWTDNDTAEALRLIDSGSADNIMNELTAQMGGGNNAVPGSPNPSDAAIQ